MAPPRNDRASAAQEALRQAILEQALPPGTKLPEDEIGKHFGMSRTLARAALVKLQSQGLVDLAHKKTATVASPSLEEAREAFVVRSVLEAKAVRLVIQRWDRRCEETLAAHVREEDDANRKGDVRRSTRLAGEFHIKLAAMSGNSLIEKYLSELVYRCSLVIAAHSRPHSAECAINEHTALIEAFKAGDAAAAERMMSDHLLSVEKRALHEAAGAVESDLGDILARYVR